MPFNREETALESTIASRQLPKGRLGHSKGRTDDSRLLLAFSYNRV